LRGLARDLADAIRGELEVPDDAEDREAYLLEMAEALRGYAVRAAELLEEEVRESRLARGACPECGEAMEEEVETWSEWHPYGSTVAEERRTVVRGYRCPYCGYWAEVDEVRRVF